MPGRDLQVTSQDRCALFDGYVLKAHRTSTPLSQHRTAAGGTRVGDPVRSLAEHGDEVALALVFGDRYREREEPSGLRPWTSSVATRFHRPAAKTIAQSRFSMRAHR